MIKPDAGERDLVSAILTTLSEEGFVEEARRTLQLDKHLISQCFLHPLPANIAYLSSAPVTFYLMRGAGGAERLYDVKWRIRESFGTGDRMRNLIHAADQGTEYHRLLDAFFPDLPPEQHCCAADLDLRLPPATSASALRRTLARLDQASSIEAVTISLQPGQWGLASVRHDSWQRLSVTVALLVRPADAPRGWALQMIPGSDDDPVEMLEHLVGAGLDGIAQWLSGKGRAAAASDVALLPAEVRRFAATVRRNPQDIDAAVARSNPQRIVSLLQSVGVTGLECFRPDLSLMEVELRCDLARLAGMAQTGGSAGQVDPGRFSISRRRGAELLGHTPAELHTSL